MDQDHSVAVDMNNVACNLKWVLNLVIDPLLYKENPLICFNNETSP